MSLVGFKARNHRQQTGKRGPNPLVDDRGTDPVLFGELHSRFGFDLDVAASDANAKCIRYYTKESDGLVQPWTGRVWCNPPYSEIRPWVAKAWSDLHWTGLIVMLLPANRTEQGWWQDLVEQPLRARRSNFRVEFLRGRPRFVSPEKAEIGPNERPPFGCCLLIWENR